jgi:hypothetical protein
MRRWLLLLLAFLAACGGSHALGVGETCTAAANECAPGLLCCCTNCDVPLNHHFACEAAVDGGACPLSG